MPHEANKATWTTSTATHNRVERWLINIAKVLPQVSPKGLKLVIAVLSLVAVLNILQMFLVYQQVANAITMVMTVLMAGLLVLLVALFVVELAGLYRWVFFLSWLDELTIERHLNNNLPIHTPSKVKLTLFSQSIPTWLAIDVMDNIADNATVHDLPAHVFANEFNAQAAAERQGVSIEYAMTPFARGQASFGGVDLAFIGRFGLLVLYRHIDEAMIQGQHSARVLANFRQSLSGHLFAAAHRSATDGLIHQRRRGQGQDFHQIRAYSEGDSIRHIDWRATSRLNRLMTKEYQDDQDQELLFLIDSSMHMRYQRFLETDSHRLADAPKRFSISHLDDVLNAMLLLTSIATSQGDSAGFISFSGVNDKVVPAKKGTSVVSHLLNQSYDIQPSLKMPDYMAVAKMAMSLQKKRSLVILITTTRSEDFDELLQAVNLLRAKHLVLVANLYESDFEDVMTTPPETPDEAFRYHAVREHLNIQHSLKLQLDNMAHVYAIHCTPERLAPLLIDNYLLMKRSQR